MVPSPSESSECSGMAVGGGAMLVRMRAGPEGTGLRRGVMAVLVDEKPSALVNGWGDVNGFPMLDAYRFTAGAPEVAHEYSDDGGRGRRTFAAG